MNRIRNYHAHVYFDAETLSKARRLIEKAGARFDLQVGRVHEKCVGPHPRWSCQLAFPSATFDVLIPWLDAHRKGLTILIHGLTGDDLADHTKHTSWLGEAVALKLELFAE